MAVHHKKDLGPPTNLMSSDAALVHSRCHECFSFDVVTDFAAGDVVCTACGVVLSDRIIDETAEWRNLPNDENKT